MLIENTQADVIIIQEPKLNQSSKTLNIPYFTPIRIDRTHKQGRDFLTTQKAILVFHNVKYQTPHPLICKLSISTFLHQNSYILQTCRFHSNILPSYYKQKKTRLYPAYSQP